jgi:hypothetical protein
MLGTDSQMRTLQTNDHFQWRSAWRSAGIDRHFVGVGRGDGRLTNDLMKVETLHDLEVGVIPTSAS